MAAQATHARLASTPHRAHHSSPEATRRGRKRRRQTASAPDSEGARGSHNYPWGAHGASRLQASLAPRYADHASGEPGSEASVAPAYAQASAAAGSAATEQTRPRAEVDDATVRYVYSWMALRMGLWSVPVRELTPLLFLGNAAGDGSSADPSTLAALPQQAARITTQSFTLPASFTPRSHRVEVPAVGLRNAGPGGWEVLPAWPARSVYLSVNGKVVPSLAPPASSPSAGVDIASACVPGNNSLKLCCYAPDAVVAQVRLARMLPPTTTPSAVARAALRSLPHAVCTMALRLAAGGGLASGRGGQTPPPGALAAAKRGQLSACQAVFEAMAESRRGKSRALVWAVGANGDAEVMATGVTLSLADPLTGAPLQWPVRGQHCTHVACMDLQVLLTGAAEGTLTLHTAGCLACPLCRAPVHWSELCLDSATLGLLHAVRGGATQGTLGLLQAPPPAQEVGGGEEGAAPVNVAVDHDGSWTLVP